MVDVLAPWAQKTPWFEQDKAKQAVHVAVTTVRQLDLKSPEALRAMDFDTAMKKYAIGYAGAKQLLAIYGLSVDDTLDSIKLSELENKDGQNMMPIPFLRQLISFYGDQMQMVVPSFLEQSMIALAKELERFREQMKTAVGKNPMDMMKISTPMKASPSSRRSVANRSGGESGSLVKRRPSTQIPSSVRSLTRARSSGERCRSDLVDVRTPIGRDGWLSTGTAQFVSIVHHD